MRRQVLRGRLPGGLPPIDDKGFGEGGSGGSSRQSLGSWDSGATAVEWDEYFDERLTVETDYGMKFNVYRKGDPTLPAILFVHGGGFTGLTWACFTKSITALTKCQCIAPDLRGHGLSSPYQAPQDPESDDFYSIANFSKDISQIIGQMPGFKNTDKPPSLALFGHSMGGAIIAHLANDPLFALQPSCIALFDVIEGTALGALPSMEAVVAKRPRHFQSKEDAISWALRTKYLNNRDSAAVSMPSQVVEEEATGKFVWRTDLMTTRPFWKEWFTGMDEKFLNTPCGPKLVLIADPSNLDKTMTIAQMQGKFQIQMLPRSGHAVHEDQPDQIATKISSYLKRFKIAEPVNGGFGADPTQRSKLIFRPYGNDAN